jgi:hypothetical protein
VERVTQLEIAEMLCKLASDTVPEAKAFAECTRGPDGIKGVKREKFGEKYQQLLASPLLRKLELRAAREGDFKTRLAEAVMLLDPVSEAEAVEIASALTRGRENSRTLPALFKLLPVGFSTFQLEAAALYPDVFKEDEK